MKSNILLLSLLFSILIFSTSQAQSDLWPIETLRTDIVGAWSRAGDFNLDGYSDILVQAGDSIYWYENLNPGWEPHLIDPAFFNSEYAWVDVQDLDGDGDLDVLKAPASVQQPNELSWNENLSNGASWEKHSILSTPNSIGWMNGSYGDLDGDGDLDIVVPEYNYGMGSLYWLEKIDSSGGYTQHMIKNGDHFFSSVSDIDGDGDLDIVSGIDQIFWLENNLPNNSWAQHQVVEPGASYHFSSICADVNGDGETDIVSNYYANGVEKLVYYSNPSWQEVVVKEGTGIVDGAIGDIDNDGDLDMTFGGSGFSGIPVAMGWAENQDDGTSWALHNIIPATTSQVFCTGLADIDTDGDLDVVALDFNVNSTIGSVFWVANPLITTGTINQTLSSIQVNLSPNPTEDFLNIFIKNQDLKDFQVQVFDPIGHLVSTSEIIDNQSISLNMKQLPEGIYLIRVYNEEGNVTKMVVKK